MNRIGTMVLGFLGVLALSGTLQASIPDKYQTIVDRNAFGLNPPAPVDTNAAPVIPPANVKLTGFTKMSGQRRAYFVIQPKDAKEQPQYINLPEGQREGILEVVKISEEDGEVRVRNSGVDMVLSLKNNGIKPAQLAPGVMPAPMGGPTPMPNPNMGGMAQPASTVYNAAAPTPVVANYVKPGTPVQPQNTGQPNQPPAPPGLNPPAPQEGLRTIPTRTLRLPPVPSPNPPTP